jgi:hypothetical protein
MSADADRVRRAEDALKRRAYEQGGADAVKQSAPVRERALKELIMREKAKK